MFMRWLLIYRMLGAVRVLREHRVFLSVSRVLVHVLITTMSVWVMWLAMCVWVKVLSRVAIGGLLSRRILVVLSLHMAVVLFGCNIVMLITLLCFLTLQHSVFWGRLCLNGFDMSWFMCMSAMNLLLVIRFHLES